jgi:hypothetical protein
VDGPRILYVDDVIRRLPVTTWLGKLASVGIIVIVYVPTVAVIHYVGSGGWDLLTEDTIWAAAMTGVLLTAVTTIWPGAFKPGRTD